MNDQQYDGRKQRDYGWMLVAAILLPIHFFLLDKIKLGAWYWGAVILGWIMMGVVEPIGVLLLVASLPLWIAGIVKAREWTVEYNHAISAN